MFKFGFTVDSGNRENDAEDTKEETSVLSWFPAERIEVSSEQLSKTFDNDDFEITNMFCDITLKILHADKVVIDLQHDDCKNIIEAESRHSDLVPAKYEGGLKIWECTYDLGRYLLSEKIPLDHKEVLDLGCGAGVIGLLAVLKGSANVHFQDYNAEVIKSITIPNVILNIGDKKRVREQCAFFSGDWESFSELESQKYDIILTSETIYNPDNQQKLYNVFKSKLKKNGMVYVAGKVYYFGVGGGMRQFEELVSSEKKFFTETVWRSEEGVQREILKLTFDT
ncbi:histidine protein methyltransferase 1 homolog isoform X2 [Athalia rosae]|uniref:histidine protein methyltransferase 1 homolog isoform X2 n=1 Tax=Athalia rosae TaxID=37344 RepID=UPI002033DEC6|nr:histidine protein methyltransferase 1 homolog isoform X2 [Athalia rosae]